MGKKGFDLKGIYFFFPISEEHLKEICQEQCCDQCHLLTVKDTENQRGKRCTLPYSLLLIDMSPGHLTCSCHFLPSQGTHII